MINDSELSYYVMLMIDGPIDALMRIKLLGFEFLCRNGSKPLKLGICDLSMFLIELVEGFCSPTC